MSISLTFFDVFAHIIPGVLFLYVINQALLSFGQTYIDLNQLEKPANLALAVVAAYILGHLFNAFSNNRWYPMFSRDDKELKALQNIWKRHPELKNNFHPSDARIFIRVIRHHTPELAQKIDVHLASSLMLNNISFGAALFTLLQIVLMIRDHSWQPYLIPAILGIFVSLAAISRASTYHEWFFRDTFFEALNYGNSLEEVLATSRKMMTHDEEKKGIKPKLEFE